MDSRLIQTASGLEYVEIAKAGARPKHGDLSACTNTGWLKSGKFDSSCPRRAVPFRSEWSLIKLD